MPQIKSSFVLTPEECQLIEKHHNLIYSFLHKYNYSVDEYYGLAALALCYAAHTYKEDLGAFSTYAYKSMYFKITRYNELQSSCTKAPKEPNLSLDYMYRDDNHEEEGQTFYDFLPDDIDIEDDIIAKICYESFVNKQSERDKKLLSLFESGLNGPEVSQAMGYSKSNANMIRRTLKDKYKKMYSIS